MVIPLVKMLFQATQEVILKTTNVTATLLGRNITATLINTFDNLESSTLVSLATLLDPRFKAIGFHSPEKAQNAARKLTAECAALVRQTRVETLSDHSPQPATSAQNPSSSASNLWSSFDRDAALARAHRNHTSDATIEVQRYLSDPPLQRSDDPLAYWNEHKNVYPHLFLLAKQYLCIPASSVPCERVFSKAGEVVSKKRNRLSPKTVEKLLFLNKNL
ncbi:E3 SUMO-protein ligase ZBED1-like [Trichomycterus rosablanca]|uniref:E3 SUMO-protein ligase ZBED1-like n=1 Tax=Trichomycterus rosablanca TaxID=2290929 RepID=UPI002F355BBF